MPLGRRGRSDIEEKSGLSEASPHYHGHRERLRSRFREADAEAVNDSELLELVLLRAIPRRDFKPLAKELIAKFGPFAEVVAKPGWPRSRAWAMPPSPSSPQPAGWCTAR